MFSVIEVLLPSFNLYCARIRPVLLKSFLLTLIFFCLSSPLAIPLQIRKGLIALLENYLKTLK